MIMLKRFVFDSGRIRYNHVVAGRVLHVREAGAQKRKSRSIVPRCGQRYAPRLDNYLEETSCCSVETSTQR